MFIKYLRRGIDFSSVLGQIVTPNHINIIFTASEKHAIPSITRHSGWSIRLHLLYFPGYIAEEDFINQLSTIRTFNQPIDYGDGNNYGCFSAEPKLRFPGRSVIGSSSNSLWEFIKLSIGEFIFGPAELLQRITQFLMWLIQS